MLPARVLAKLDEPAGVISAEPRLAENDISDHHRMAVRRGCFRRVHQPHFAVLGIRDGVADEGCVMAAALEILAIPRVAEFEVLECQVVALHLENSARMRQCAIHYLICRVENWPGGA